MASQTQLDDRLVRAAESGDLKALLQALEDGANAKAAGSYALRQAAAQGHSESVRRLIPISDPLVGASIPLQLAALGGHLECVKLLIPVSDPMANGSYALQRSAGEGYAQCVRLLIPVSDPFADKCCALRWAARNGHMDCVALLLPVSDPLATGHSGLNAASSARVNGHMEAAGMIEAFVEARDLFDCCGAGRSSRSPFVL